MLPVVRWGTQEAENLLENRKTRIAHSDGAVRQRVESLLQDIRSRGWAACDEISLKLDNHSPKEVGKEDILAAVGRCDPALLSDLRAAAERILDYQRRLLPRDNLWENADGGTVGQIVRPLQRVGLYVPGGTAAYPSTVLMLACPAKAAGVEELVVFTPPGDFLRDAVLAACHVAGVDRVFALGGVPAIAAAAWGLGPVPRCDKIVGPSNAYVQEAKRQLSGETGIDFLAGPSDILVLADDSADPEWLAADLLSQAEHDPLARAVLVCMDENTARKAMKALERQLSALPRKSVAEQSLRDYGAVFLCDTEAQAAQASDCIAPEHLEIMTREPKRILPLIRHAGAVFLGAFSPEPLGDYYAGPSHVLPTDGTARFTSATSVDMFLKKSSVIAYDAASFAKAGDSVVRMARSEDLDAHARSAALRMAKIR